ncbi:hypothetical protein Hypma_010421 [Hypsizygus marmoreus]|uniref:Uncharacterized protein n=1 Tax=Hypsizygus marmoreus TaxID=39966 RepID=A0A369JKP8_HYPMA|nr:hypothetical protein Hypma_010421 [Hypsizygus marmoreus]
MARLARSIWCSHQAFLEQTIEYYRLKSLSHRATTIHRAQTKQLKSAGIGYFDFKSSAMTYNCPDPRQPCRYILSTCLHLDDCASVCFLPPTSGRLFGRESRSVQRQLIPTPNCHGLDFVDFGTTLGHMGAAMDFNALVVVFRNTPLNCQMPSLCETCLVSGAKYAGYGDDWILALVGLSFVAPNFPLYLEHTMHRNFLILRTGIQYQERLISPEKVMFILIESCLVFFASQTMTRYTHHIVLLLATFILMLCLSPVPGCPNDIAAQIYKETYLDFTVSLDHQPIPCPTEQDTAIVICRRAFVDTCGFSDGDIKSVHVHAHTANAVCDGGTAIICGASDTNYDLTRKQGYRDK